MRSGDGGSAQVAGAPTNAAGEAPTVRRVAAASVPRRRPRRQPPPRMPRCRRRCSPPSHRTPTVRSSRVPPDTSLPADAASTVFPNDVRFDGMPLPEATPDGYCVVDHQAGAGLDGISLYTVWASCADCAEPTAAIALIRSPIPVTDDPSHVSNDPSQATGAIAVPMGDGRGGFFVPPSETSAISTLYTTDAGGATVVFAGWGLEQDEFVAFAEAATTTGAALPSELVQVYDGPLSDFFLTTIPTNHNFHIAYAHRHRDGVALVRRVVRRHDVASRHPPAVDGARLGRPELGAHQTRRRVVDRLRPVSSATAASKTMLRQVDAQLDRDVGEHWSRADVHRAAGGDPADAGSPRRPPLGGDRLRVGRLRRRRLTAALACGARAWWRGQPLRAVPGPHRPCR